MEQENGLHIFSDLPCTAEVHLRLHFYAALLGLIPYAVGRFGSMDALLDRFPFLAGYLNELAERGLDGVELSKAPARWCASIEEWEGKSEVHLPLRALSEAGELDRNALVMVAATLIVDEDGRFAQLFSALDDSASRSRPTAGILTACSEEEDTGVIRSSVRQLVELGVLTTPGDGLPFPDRSLEVPEPLADALRGQPGSSFSRWARFRPTLESSSPEEVVLPEATLAKLLSLGPLLSAGEVAGVCIRGPHHNGRSTLAGALARSLERGVLEISGLNQLEDSRWKLVGPLATALRAMPLFILDPAPGETLDLPTLTCYNGPIAVVLERHGGIRGALVEQFVTVTLAPPDAEARQRLWRRVLPDLPQADLAEIAQSTLLTSGNIVRAGRSARREAALAGRAVPNGDDLRSATAQLGRTALETLARRVEVQGSWQDLVVAAETRSELGLLQARCRSREHLPRLVSPVLSGQLNRGVRALLKGPSGTGKTLAARLLAAALRMELYRVDLSAVISKYIGETEKNLNRVFSCAEELDILLLLDEGDALLGRRTSVTNSTDRYANIETNFLLTRLEAYEGVVLVTTNLAEQIDTAFERRMDVVIEFRLPGPDERFSIWQLHLPIDHRVNSGFLEEVAERCALTGGQIRNAVLHAMLLALESAQPIFDLHLDAAIQREYRKAGSVCPLRRLRSASLFQ